MDTLRVVLYAALAVIVYNLWTSWQHDYPSVAPKTSIVAPTSKADDGSLLPHMDTKESSDTPVNTAQEEDLTTNEQKSALITVKTDVLAVTIDTQHGDIISAKLLDYPVSIEQQNTPFTLLNDQKGKRYVANSSLFVSSDNTVQNVDFNFTSDKPEYVLEKGQDELKVILKGKSADGLQVTKTFEFTRGNYLVNINYSINNESDQKWKGYLNTQLLRSSPDEDKSSIFHVGSYVGASYSNPGQHNYQKVSFSDMTKRNLEATATGGWVAMQQHYFLSALIPDSRSKHTLYTRASNDNYTIGVVSEPIQIASGNNKDVSFKLYMGPEITSNLKEIAPGLDMTVDYGWLFFLSQFLFWLMKGIHSFVGNWGWSIVLVTVLIKLVFYRLSASSYRSMAGMRKLQPKLQALKERYGDDKAKMSQATMELYRQEKVNPLGGCLPILVQIPVFIALYWVLLESVELRQAPFIFWIKDLSSADPYYVLPIIMGATMLVQQRLNPAPPDPVQAKLMMFLPLLFTALFWNFPSGLVLYWIVNNTLAILQQWYITRKYSEVKPGNKKLAVAK